MREKRRNGRVATKTSVEEEIAHLRGSTSRDFRAMDSVFQDTAASHSCRGICCSPSRYRIQADRLGDLDHETMQVLIGRLKETAAAMSARLVSFDQKRTELNAGNSFGGEWIVQSQRVMVMSAALPGMARL